MSVLSKRRALVELVIASLFWGFGFIAVKWAFQSFSSFGILFLRFAMTGVIGVALSRLILKDKSSINFSLNAKSAWRSGLALCLLLWFQTVGLEYTTAVNSSFITTLYVIHVPILYGLFYKKFQIEFIFYGLIALTGVLFLIAPPSEHWNPLQALSLDFNKGDVLTLICSVCAALQILFVEADIKKSSNFFNFNSYQFLLATFFLLPFLFLEEREFMHSALTPLSVLGVLILVFGCSLIAFFLQVRSQSIIDSKVVSFLFLLEAPFATFFAIFLLQENLTLNQIYGTLIIFLSCFLVLRREN